MVVNSGEVPSSPRSFATSRGLPAPVILDYEVNGRIWRRMGNRDLVLCPRGVYPTRGDDRWVAIACQSDAVWRSMCEAMGLDEAGKDPRLATAEGLRQRARSTHWTPS